MVQANELRINNWYNVGLTGNTQPQQFNNWTEALDFEGYGEPIPLTPEILEKCGFSKYGDNGRYSLNQIVIDTKAASDAFKVLKWDGNDLYSITYVTALHELQNIFSSLFGEELQVNL